MTSPFPHGFDPSNPPPADAPPPQSMPVTPPSGSFHVGPQYGTDYTFGVPQAYSSPYQGTARPPAPSPVVWATIVFVVAAVLSLFTAIFTVMASQSGPYGMTNGSLTLAVVGVLTSGGVAAFLAFRPGRAAQITATVLAALWIVTCVGLLTAIPALLLLWIPPSSRTYFAAVDQWRAANPT